MGSLAICLNSTLLGLFMLTFANEFLKFGLISIPIFIAYVNIPLLQFLGVIDLGFIAYIFPIQGSLDLLDTAILGSEINYLLSYSSIAITLPLFYWLAYNRFNKKIVHH